jgi:hypothetical protein
MSWSISKREVQDLRPRLTWTKNASKYVSFDVKNVHLISLRQNHNYKENEGKMIDTDEGKLLLDAFKLVGIDRRDRIPNCRGLFQLEINQRKV